MNFFDRVKSFNKTFGIHTPQVPNIDRIAARDRLDLFLHMIKAEIREGDEIYKQMGDMALLDVMTNLADWYGDIIVYCASEMARHGLPPEAVLAIIMDSNDSKLQADGTALFIDGNLQKGPNYWKPEPKIRTLIEALLRCPTGETDDAS